MKLEVYNEIIATIKKIKHIDIHSVSELKEKFPNVKTGALSNILSNEHQKTTRTKYARARDASDAIYAKYEKGKSLLQLADEHHIPYSLCAKLVLTKHYEEHKPEVDNTIELAKRHLRDSSLIEDKNLAYQVFICTLYDCNYSPINEIVRMNLGQQYEIKLFKKMEQLGIAYRTEEYMRKFGFDKTPDVKLEIPIAVDGFIVRWIESKARFGDHEVHQEYLKAQYTSYWNRFGPGLIIYWYGFVEGIEDHGQHNCYIIRDCLPANIVKLR